MDDAQVTHVAPELAINTMPHLRQAAMVFGSSLFSRVTSHGKGAFLLALSLSSTRVSASSAIQSFSGSRSFPQSVVVDLDKWGGPAMVERASGGAWEVRVPTPHFCRKEGGKK